MVLLPCRELIKSWRHRDGRIFASFGDHATRGGSFAVTLTNIVFCMQMRMHFRGDPSPILIMRFEPRPHRSVAGQRWTD